MSSTADTDTLRPRAREIVAAARDVLEEEGPDALTMRRLGERLGIRAPSLYKHFRDKRALENELISLGFDEIAVTFERAVKHGPDRLVAIGAAYRRFGRRHPHLYRLMTERPLDRAALRPGVEERAARPVLDAVDGDADLARAAWAFAHGMTILELNGRFPPDADLEAAWERGLDAFRAGTR